MHREASGDVTVVASGGLLFRLPSSRLGELAPLLSEALRAAAASVEPLKALELLVASGSELGEEGSLAQALVRMDEERRAEAKAAELCARAEQCRSGLVLKLRAKGFGQAAAARAVAVLEGEGLLDDGRYAETWARGRLRRRPMGPAPLGAELRAKGLGAEVVRRALDSIDFSAVLPRVAEFLAGRRGAVGDALRAELRTQGFDYEDLERYFGR